MRFGFAAGCSWKVQPTDIALTPFSGSPTYNFTSLQHTPGVYKIYVTKGSTSQSPDILADMTAVGGDLADINGVGAATVSVSAFQSGAPNNAWNHVGYITNSVANPEITFTYASGTLASATRWYMDAVRFEYLDPCTGVAPQLGVAGPVAAGQTNVTVTGVVGAATNVTVYANGSPIGSTNSPSGFAAGSLTVDTTALVKGDVITAGQTATNSAGGACVGSVPGSGPIVGGGPNEKVKVSLGLWRNAAFAGPVGADTTSGLTVNYFLKSSGLTSGFNSAPAGGQELLPSTCWQTVTFSHATDPAILAGTGGGVTNTDPFCALEGLVFSLADADTGPYDIYVDSIMNGNTMIEDFESYAVDTVSTLNTPNAAGTPPAASSYLSSPNSTMISSSNAFDGTKSARIQWQWADANNVRWAHILANAPAGKRYPQLDTTKPITVRYLVLPVGSSTGTAFNGTVSSITNINPTYVTATNTLGVTVTGSGSYTYAWTWSGGALPNPTDGPTYTIDGLGAGASAADNGTYTVTVSDGTCAESRSIAFTVADPIPTIATQPAVKTITNVGGTASLTVVGTAPVAAGLPLTYQWRHNGNDLLDATDATFTTNNVQIVDAGYYTVVVANNYGSVTSAVATLDVVQPGVVVGSGTGLRGNYWSNAPSSSPFLGAFVLNRVDPTINFNFGGGSPDPAVSSNLFSARWFGQVRALDTDTYTFYTTTDDGVRLWVNGQLLVNSWINQAPTEHSGNIALTANQHYDILMEYFENAVGAVATLSWSGAGGGVVKEIIPASQLYPGTSLPVPSLSFSQYDGTNLVFNFGPGTYALAWATNVTGPYDNIIPAVTSPYTNIIGNDPQRFFRLLVQ